MTSNCDGSLLGLDMSSPELLCTFTPLLHRADTVFAALGQPVVAVRFCPVLFKLRQPHASDNLAFQLPYRMVFALATLDSIVVYDTQVPACLQATGMHVLTHLIRHLT